MANKPLKTIKFPNLEDTYTIPQVDATLTQTGQAADAKKTGDEITGLKEDITNIESGDGTRLKLVTTTTGAYINANGGVITGQGNSFVVKQYKVERGATVRLYGKGVRLNASLPLVTFRDSTGSVSTSVTVVTGTNVATDYSTTYSPAVDGFIYVAIVTSFGELIPYYDNTFDTLSTIKLKELISSESTATESALNASMLSEFSKIAITSPNLFDKDSVVNGYVSTSTGNIVSDTTWRTSDFIAIDEDESYYCAVGGTYGFYNANKVFLGYGTSALITPLTNSAYIRKSVKVVSLDVCVLVKGSSAPQFYYPYGYIGLTDDMLKKDVSSKVLQTFGDSMVGMELWQSACAFRLGFASYINSGNSGYKMSDTGDTASTPINTVIINNLNADADFITIWGGTNDFYGNAVLGTPADAVNTTFYGALNLATKYICENYPNKRIMFITPLNRFDDLSARFEKNADDEYINTQGKTLEDYVNAMIDVCRRNSIKCLDFYHDGGLNKWNQSALMSDGIHPTSAYFDVLGKRIAENILMLI